ncbi:helix-turn-helix domain-containing protein [Curtobacterium sp. MCSS17_016]|uniref:helix-turn-helix transcriptional regulator n=1 Tax=Curtobacterium sp. MCSS17_016 TaxID=2175644 RepID=UPI000DA6F3D9|nr:helix-turn-helix domain-containing protein [Curtobacterium sp. MCSS17_016]WIE79259.1 helix-turn-helix domain-containing protein [Curtobacterium sp. MCSS17_016]
MSTAVTVAAPRLNDLLTPDALAAQLHTTTRNLREWRSTGRGPRFVRVGRLPLYRLEAVEEWLREQEFASTTDELR